MLCTLLWVLSLLRFIHPLFFCFLFHFNLFFWFLILFHIWGLVQNIVLVPSYCFPSIIWPDLYIYLADLYHSPTLVLWVHWSWLTWIHHDIPDSYFSCSAFWKAPMGAKAKGTAWGGANSHATCTAASDSCCYCYAAKSCCLNCWSSECLWN